MSALHTALAAERLWVESPAWVLLRARNAPAAIALLGQHLGGEVRRRSVPELFELIEEDLVELRAHGFELPRPARGYCDDWRQDGVLVRRPVEGTREETYELSDGALVAIRFVLDLMEPRSVVTESRLGTILARVRELSLATDPSAATRLAALSAERDRIDAEIARVRSGDFDVLDADRAVERARDVLALADELPADFARVRGELERLNRALRARLVDDVDSRGTVLDDIFRGVDHLAESEAGRSFDGFFGLILDAERVTAFEDDVDDLLARPFADRLTASQARTLRRLLPGLQDASGEIHDVMTTFSRSLRRFVQTDELAEHREVQRRLRAAQREAAELAHTVQPFARTRLELDLTSVPFESVGALALHNPADHRTASDVEVSAHEQVDWEELVQAARDSEIDLVELRAHVNDAVGRLGALTVAEVLAEHPPTQGLAGVVGMLVLADEHATALDGAEPVSWTAPTGVARRGTVPRRLFTAAVP
ncbi:DUF3375 domain-containing protein [Cellulomonas fimi]|uniref:DUF3375 domain-containing protein n=1 Tax=Cellulomonas fimi TaxID=1708 RepID=A0A7Y0LYY0_CELFI|nr:DUF3375 domain-containing protein [Cellulomonas fimi]NMR20465.1 DUF3375 domain-containing protein [Cellulomonas fimi]